jgi:two-component system, chemotaxis family, sensor kinase CheA
MNEDKRRRLENKFRRLTAERITALGGTIVSLENDAAAHSGCAEIARVLHTIKGEARLLGLAPIADIAHGLEELVTRIESEGVRSDLVAAVLAGLDEIQRAVGTEVLPAAEGLASPPEASAVDVRVPVERLQNLTDMATQLALAQARTSALLLDFEQLESEVDGRAAARIRHLVLRVREQARATDVMSTELLDHLRTLQLVRLSDGLVRYPRAVRELGVDLGKQVRLDLDVGSVEIDRGVLDELHEPLLHLLRNAVDHGCERPDVRQAAGKPPTCTIELRARIRGLTLLLTVQDDGAGISLDAVDRAARRRGLVDDEASVAAEDLASLVFAPGFSTRANADQVSGRGIGLDAVKQRVERIGGRIALETWTGRGTRFSMQLPVSSMQLKALAVRVETIELALPMDSVLEVLDRDRVTVERPGDAPAFRWMDHLVALHDLGEIIGLERSTASGHVLVIEPSPAAVPFGLVVDRVLGERQVLHRAKGQFLAGSRYLRDVGISSDGETMVVLDPGAFGTHVPRSGPTARPSRGASIHVVVADDSEVTRDLVTKLIRERGHRVTEAVNGEDAWTKILEHRPDVIFTDLEMPLLDGFGLLERVRASTEHRDTPVVVLSTRGGADDIRRASELGGSAYLVKSSFDETKLDRVLARLAPTREDG